MRTLLSPTSLAHSFLVSALAASAHGQGFGGQRVITQAVANPWHVYATDLDGDGDADVLSASGRGIGIDIDSKIAWYENLGGGAFGSQRVITQSADTFTAVYATDLDGDGDADVLSASYDDKIAWYENLGGGAFGYQRVITQAADRATAVYATDLDGDGDADVLSASFEDDKISWYENIGGEQFGAQQVITQAADGAQSVYATDLDGDGDADVLSASSGDHKIAWYENLGDGSFGNRQVISLFASGTTSVYATDLDGDGDADVLSACPDDYKIAWYENLGGGSFSAQQVITRAANEAVSVYATDLDGDGDADVLSAGYKVVWYENLGLGSFGGSQVITQSARNASSVYATDLDGDGDADVLSANFGSGQITWHGNISIVDCNRNGIHDDNDLLAGLSLDCNGNGTPDECEIANGFDCNGNGIPDSCDIASGFAPDCNNNGIPDTCDVARSPTVDVNLNGVPDSCEVAGSSYWILSPVTGNWYAVTDKLRAEAAAQIAIEWGGHLVTINDQAENDWLAAQFGDETTPFWIGINDVAVEGSYCWMSGEPVTYSNWTAGEADDAPGLFGADFTVLLPATGKWFDEPADTPTFAGLPRGVVELESSDCDGNGIPDARDIAADPTTDANLNSVPDSCEVAGSSYWILSPVTGNWYAVTDELPAEAAAQTAIEWGGHLVTINDQAENDWLAAQFGDETTPFWIGLIDVAQEGSYSWLSGEPVTYTNWVAGRADDAPGLFGADFTVLLPSTGKWLDEPADALTFEGLPRGVVEMVSDDCDSNGIPDAYELHKDPSLDRNDNGVLDACD